MTHIFVFFGIILASSFIIGACISLYEDNKKQDFLEKDKLNQTEVEKAKLAIEKQKEENLKQKEEILGYTNVGLKVNVNKDFDEEII